MSEVIGTIECSDENTMKLLKHVAELQSENATLRAQLELCKEQRNEWLAEEFSPEQLPKCIEELDLELQKKGQGE
jgi:predicted RNase H-like nuclease (RuvC/YqgF family)